MPLFLVHVPLLMTIRSHLEYAQKSIRSREICGTLVASYDYNYVIRTFQDTRGKFDCGLRPGAGRSPARGVGRGIICKVIDGSCKQGARNHLLTITSELARSWQQRSANVHVEPAERYNINE